LCLSLQRFGGGGGGGVVGGGGGGVVASLHSLCMLPLSTHTLEPVVQPTGILHSGPVWFSVNC
jgi:hypothetical protein